MGYEVSDPTARMWAMLLHLSVFLGYLLPIAGLVAPILIWQLGKEKYPELDVHGKIVANFLLSMLIYVLVASLLVLCLVGIVILPVLIAVGIVFPIIGGVKAYNGEVWPYPWMLTIVR